MTADSRVGLRRERTRAALLAALLVATGGVTGCGDDAGSAMDAGDASADVADVGRDTAPPPPPEASYDGPRISDVEAESGRASCAFGRGAMPFETLGESWPIGDDIPIDHLILVLQENRSFDHYFGAMPGIEGIPVDATNPDAAGEPVAPYHETEYCIEDVSHGWDASHRQWNGGLNDGFVTTNDPGGARALGYFDESDLPFYWDLARTFAMSDHHHCSVLGPTWVNRFYYMSGTSFGNVSNDPIPEDRKTAPWVIFQQLDGAGVDYRIYNSDVPFVLGGYPLVGGRAIRKIKPVDQLFRDLEAGTMPPVAWVDPSFTQGVTQSDEHPPANPQAGQRFIADIVAAAMASPDWERTAIVISYDEHGGFYDHVAPPLACSPGDYAPDLDDGREPGAFDRLGFRVPLMVVSPWARRGHVSDRVTDLTSILRLVQTRWLLAAMTGRDANAWPLLDMFDFEGAPDLTVPELAPALIDEAKMDRCVELFGAGGRFEL